METTLTNIRVSKRKSLREEVYESLRKSIIHGKLKAGQRLIEEQLAHQAGISRTPVREADMHAAIAECSDSVRIMTPASLREASHSESFS